MVDLAAITAILGSVKTATEIAKLLNDSDLSLEKAEMKLKLAELINALADTKIELAAIQDVISEKDGKIKELEEVLEVKKKMHYEKPYYWMIDDGKREGPFCQKCYDSEGKQIRLQDKKNGYWKCEACERGFEDSTFRESRSAAVTDYDPFNY